MRLGKVNIPDKGRFFSHVIVIVMLFVLPEIILSYASPRHGRWTWVMYMKSAAAIAVFYINYYLVIGRTLFGPRRRVWAMVLWNVVLLVSVLALLYWLQHLLMPSGGGRHHHHQREWLFYSQFAVRDLVMLILTIALALALRLADKWSSVERHNAQLLAAQRQDELVSLKSQINPHFLFNILNTIYSLIEVDPRQAQQAVHKLSKLLRHVLYENPSTVDIDNELEFVRSYIDLMEIRLGDGAVKATFDVPPHSGVEVPPLLMVTLLENAFKHGNTGVKDQPIEISVRLADGTLTCRTFNHFIPGKKTGQASGGIGIANLRRRLTLLYGDRASLSTVVRDDTYTATLTIMRQSRDLDYKL